jgi:uncharacterized glyoxalase superfamily protein PhnB
MQNIYPALRYQDAPAAIDWLCTAFAFERQAVYEGENGIIEHAQLSYRGGLIMLGSERATDEERGFGRHAGQGWLYVVVEDPDAHYERAKAAGAQIVRELEDQEYGSRDYAARDPEGNLWSFGTYNPTAESTEAPSAPSAAHT